MIKKSFIVLILSTGLAFAGYVRLMWDASPDTNVVGYAIYHGPSSGNYSTRIEVGNKLNIALTNLANNSNYYFVATAYTAEGIESLPSNEVNGYPNTNAFFLVLPPTNLRIIQPTN
jgi:hypothetical protein